MRGSVLLLFLPLSIGCGKATLTSDGGNGDGDGDGGGDCGGICTSDQACIDDVCENLDDVAVPTYATRWRPVTGWLVETDTPIQATFDAVDIPGITYQCRTGHDSVFAALPFTPCDGGDGTSPTHAPTPTADQEEGGYRTEMRLARGDWTSDAIGFDFYAHHSLDNVRECAPPATDAAVFAVAADQPSFVAQAFPAGTVVEAPFIHLPFRNVIKHINMNDGWAGLTTGDPMDIDIDTLRRRFALSPDRKLLLVQRTYVSRMALANKAQSTCRNGFRFGVNHWNNTAGTPTREYVDCPSLVLNSRGESLCIDTNQASPVLIRSDIGWAKLIPRREAFSLKGIPEACVASADRRCWDWYLETPE
jgi:hypothetical protein